MATITLTQTTKNNLATSLYELLGGNNYSPKENFIISSDMGNDGNIVNEVFLEKMPGGLVPPGNKRYLSSISSYVFRELVDGIESVSSDGFDHFYFPLRSIPVWKKNINSIEIENKIGLANENKEELLVPYTGRFRDICFIRRQYMGPYEGEHEYNYKIVMFYRYKQDYTDQGESGIIFVKNFSVTF